MIQYVGKRIESDVTIMRDPSGRTRRVTVTYEALLPLVGSQSFSEYADAWTYAMGRIHGQPATREELM